MDEYLFFLINGSYTPFFDSFFLLITKTVTWIPIYLLLPFLIWKNYGLKTLLIFLLMIGIGILFTDVLNCQVIRPLIGRLRPSNPDNQIYPLVRHLKGGGNYGFPSAHSSNLWFLTIIVIYFLRDRLTAISMIIMSAASCYSRIYIGVHYPTDILGGFVFALLVALPICWYCSKKLHFVCKESRLSWLTALGIGLIFFAAAIMST